MKTNKLDVKYYLIAFIETFSIWQMGIIFYSSKTLTVNNPINTPITLNNSILIVFLGYLIGIMTIFLFPKKTIILGRISMLLSLLSTILLFFPISALFFQILYYISTFCCVFFISINTSLIINYYSLKSALADAILGTIISSFVIAICQNSLIPLSFNTFNILSSVCLTLVVIALFKLPSKFDIKLLTKIEKAKKPPVKMVIGLGLIQTVTCLLTLFSASMAESIKSGVSITYTGGFISGLLFLFLYKKRKPSPFKIAPYYFGITSIGFLLYLLPFSNIKYIALLLQGFNYFIILLAPFLIANLFQIYPSKIIAPVTVLLALLTVFISSIITESFRSNPTLLYSIYTIISVISTIIYFMAGHNMELQQYTKKEEFNKLSVREKEVANLLIKGYTLKEIANTLFLSEHTVKDHIKSIYQKYDVHSKVELMNIVSLKN